jgi:hypothetical protein
MQIPILNGIFTDSDAEFRTSYPRNLIPVPKEQGISKGYLKPADGIVEFGIGPGTDRGAVNWNGECFRVMGTKFVKVNSAGAVVVLGDVGGTGQVTFDYSFDRLAISSGGAFYYWDGATLTKVTDSDLGGVIDFIWVDGYYMTTDGVSLVVTELNDPFSVNPLKYGSAEADPDRIVGILKLRSEPYAIGRYTIEGFRNIGGNLFPFQRIEGAQIMRGAIGTYACCVYLEAIAFVGGGRNEPCAVWLGLNGTSAKISTREIDTILQQYSEEELSTIVVEARVEKGWNLLYIHLPDQCLVYDAEGSKVVGEPVWFSLTSSIVGNGEYRAKNLVWAYGKWIFGDPTSNKLGTYSNLISSHYGEINGWDFGTLIIYNQSRGAIFHELELIALPGSVALADRPFIWTSYSLDGKTWSNEVPRPAGRQGHYDARINWLQQGNMINWRIQRFRGTSEAHMSFARLEARIEPLR